MFPRFCRGLDPCQWLLAINILRLWRMPLFMTTKKPILNLKSGNPPPSAQARSLISVRRQPPDNVPKAAGIRPVKLTRSYGRQSGCPGAAGRLRIYQHSMTV